MRATAAERVRTPANTYLICAAAWLVPGAGHLWQGRMHKGVVFLVMLPLMFATGLWLEGSLVPFRLREPLVFGMALAEVGNGLPYFLAKALGAGVGSVVSITYDYGNAFMIVAGLLNALVVLDAYDIAQGRK